MKHRAFFVALLAGLAFTFDPALKAADPGDQKPSRVIDL
jgi:hypothetical protein